MIRYYDAHDAISTNAPFTFVLTGRNRGKTWAFKKRSWKRGIKRGKKTIWLRTFRQEAKECIASFFTSSDLQQFCGIVPYDPETKQGNFKQIGNTFYCKRGKRWEWFLKVMCVSNANALRSADDVNIDTIVYDECTTTPARYARYRGNMVEDFIDIFISMKRMHTVRAFLLGNKEAPVNPFLQYFGIKTPERDFDGIRSFKNGSVVVEQRNGSGKRDTQYESAIERALEGTAYGRYLYSSDARTGNTARISRAPVGCRIYTQIYTGKGIVRIVSKDGTYWCDMRVDRSQPVHSIVHTTCTGLILTRNELHYFNDLVEAVQSGQIYYDAYETLASVLPFFRWLGLRVSE